MIDVLAETIQRCNAIFEIEIEQSEMCLIDAGCTGEEIDDALGRGGFWRAKLEENRDAHIAEIRRWVLESRVCAARVRLLPLAGAAGCRGVC